MDIYSLCNLAVTGTISLLDSFMKTREPYSYSVSPPRDNVEPVSVPCPVKRRNRRRIVKLEVKSCSAVKSKSKSCKESSSLEQNSTRFISLYSASRYNQSKRSSLKTRRKVCVLETILEEEPLIKPVQISQWQAQIFKCIPEYHSGRTRD